MRTITNLHDLAKLFDLPSWQTIKKLHSDESDEYGIEYAKKSTWDKDTAFFKGKELKEDEQANKWYKAIVSIITTLLDVHKVKLMPVGMPDCSGNHYYFRLRPTSNWKISCRELAKTVNGSTGILLFESEEDLLNQSICETYDQLFMDHLNYIKNYPKIYSEPSTRKQFYKLYQEN